MATHSSALAWRIPWTGEPGRLQCVGSQRVGHNLETKQQQPQGKEEKQNLKLTLPDPETRALLSLLLRLRHQPECPSETPRTAAHQAPLSMGFSRQERWSG